MPVGHGITLSEPPGWHLVLPPITSTAYPLDRLLLTTYRAGAGGQCSPTRAEAALPANGALIYLLEYGSTAGTVLTRPPAADSSNAPPNLALSQGTKAAYECWLVPSYLLRFRAAGRLFQAQVAFGSKASAQRRAEALRILNSLKINRLAPAIRH
jgi:hypothetical protein